MVIQKNQPFNRWLLFATYYAERSEHKIYKMSAVIVKNGTVIAAGFNKNRTHPKAKNYTRKIHAELDALIGFRLPVENADIYVVRITNGRQMATSKPCKDCVILLKEAGIKTMTYIDENGIICREKL